MNAQVAAWLGYDPDRVSELTPRFQRTLAVVAVTALPGLGLLSLSAAYGAFLASDSIVLGVAIGVGAGLYLLNLLRVAVAGGGVGPQKPYADVTHWMPRPAPLLMLALLGMFFAQPLILALLHAEQDAPVAALRQSLEARHAASSAQAQNVDAYRRQLARSHFLVRRVQLSWEQPERPLALSIAMVLLMVLPWVASATLGRTASRAYESQRWRASRALIDAAYAQARRLEAEALSQWATFSGPRLELYEDPPYNTRPRQGAGAYEARRG